MTVSIIIAVKTWQKNLEECVDRCLRQDYPDLEIIVLPDSAFDRELPERVRVIPTGPVTPPKKRDIGAAEARGEILAFIDDDAYPAEGWLRQAVPIFADLSVGAVGGPAVTPASDGLLQQASGLVYSSFLVSSTFIYRYLPMARREVDDFPSCNLLVRKDVFVSAGGFNTNFWPGEDTKLCLDITRHMGKKIVYDPAVLVYHHRRRLFGAHLRQVANYALHRGYFVKRFPETSLKPAYFVPSAFVLFLFSGFLFPVFDLLYIAILGLYALLAAASAFALRPALAYLVFPGIVLTHLVYGLYFMKGLLKRRLKEE